MLVSRLRRDLLPGTPPEEVTWFPVLPTIPVTAAPRRGYVDVVAPINTTTPATVTWFAPIYPDRIEAKKSPVNQGGVFITLALAQLAIPTLAWQAEYPDRIDPKKSSIEGGEVTITLALAQLAVPNLSWFPDYPDQIARKVPVIEGGKFQTLLAPFDPRSNVGWDPVFPDGDRARDRSYKLRYVNEGGLFQTLLAPFKANENVSWLPSYPDRIVRIKNPIEGGCFYTSSLSNLGVPPLAWEPEYPATPQRVPFDPNKTSRTSSWDSNSEFVPVLAWQPEYPDRIDVKKSAAVEGETVEPFVPPAPPALSWSAEYPDGVIRVLTSVKYPPEYAANVFPLPSITVTPLSWQPEYPDRIDRKVVLGEGGTSDEPTLPPDPPLLSWKPTYPDKIDRLYLKQSTYAFTNPLPPDPPLLSWSPTYPERVLPLTSVKSPPSFIQNILPLPNQAVPPLAWEPEYPDQFRFTDRARVGFNYTVESIATLPAPTLAWQPSYPDVLFRAQQTRVSEAIEPLIPIAAPAPALSWLSVYPDAAAKAKSASVSDYVEPLFQFPPPILSWLSVYPDKINVAPRSVQLLTENKFDPFPLPSIAVPPLAWLATYPDKINVVRLVPEGLNVSTIVKPDAPLLSWKPSYPDFAIKAKFNGAGESVEPSVDGYQAKPLSWKATYPDSIYRPPVNVGPYKAEPVFFTIPATSWLPTYPDKIDKAFLARISDITSPVLKVPDVSLGWLPNYPDFATKAFLPKALYVRACFNPEEDAPVITQSPVAFLPDYPDFARKAKDGNQYLGGVAFSVPQPEAKLIGWSEVTYPDSVRKAKDPNTYTGYFSWSTHTPVVALSWHPTYPDFILPKASPLRLNRYEVVTAFISPTTSWLPTYPSILLRKPQPQIGWIAGLNNLDRLAPPALSWKPVYPDRIDVKKPAAEGAFTTVTSLVNLPVNISWIPRVPDQIYRPKAITFGIEEFFVPVVLPAGLPWAPVYPDKIFAKNRASVGQELFVPGLPNEPIPALSWSPTYPDLINRRPQTKEGLIVVVEGLSSFSVPPLSWNSFYDPVPKVATNLNYLQRFFFANPTVEPLPLSWKAVYPDQHLIKTNPGTYAGSVNNVFSLGSFAVPVLSWNPSYPDFAKAKDRTKEGFSQTVIGLSSFAIPNLSWDPKYPSIIIAKKLPTSLQQTFAGILPVPPRPPLVNGEIPWVPTYPDIVWAAKRVSNFLATTRQLVIVEPIQIPGRVGMAFRIKIVFTGK